VGWGFFFGFGGGFFGWVFFFFGGGGLFFFWVWGGGDFLVGGVFFAKNCTLAPFRSSLWCLSFFSQNSFSSHLCLPPLFPSTVTPHSYTRGLRPPVFHQNVSRRSRARELSPFPVYYALQCIGVLFSTLFSHHNLFC